MSRHRLGIATTALLLACLAPSTGCSWWSKNVQPVVNHVIDCAKAEEQAVTKGKSIIQITMDVVVQVETAIQDALAAGGDWQKAAESAVSSLVKAYGEPIVACVLHDTQPAAPQASQYPDPIGIIIAQHGWQFKQ